MGSVSQWNRTSKDQGCRDSYGLKGQALSALEELSHLIIITTPPQCSCTYIRDHRQQISSVGKASSIHAADESGTVVKVLNLFHNLPVRRCSTRKETELSSIREYIQHMSVLHHSVHWSVHLLCPPNSSYSSSILGRTSQLHIAAPIRGSSSSCLLDLVAQVSVVDRLTAIHGRSIISKLEVCCVCYCVSYYLPLSCTVAVTLLCMPTCCTVRKQQRARLVASLCRDCCLRLMRRAATGRRTASTTSSTRGHY